MAADALPQYVTRSPTAMALTIWDKRIYIADTKGLPERKKLRKTLDCGRPQSLPMVVMNFLNSHNKSHRRTALVSVMRQMTMTRFPLWITLHVRMARKSIYQMISPNERPHWHTECAWPNEMEVYWILGCTTARSWLRTGTTESQWLKMKLNYRLKFDNSKFHLSTQYTVDHWHLNLIKII